MLSGVNSRQSVVNAHQAGGSQAQSEVNGMQKGVNWRQDIMNQPAGS